MQDRIYNLIEKVALEIKEAEVIGQLRIQKYGGDYLVHFNLGETNNRFFVRTGEYVLAPDKEKFVRDLYYKSPWIKEMRANEPRTAKFKKRASMA
jgi:hypothetical protein